MKLTSDFDGILDGLHQYNGRYIGTRFVLGNQTAKCVGTFIADPCFLFL